MQAFHCLAAAGVILLAALIAAPLLLTAARRRAFDYGLTSGLEKRNSIHSRELEAARNERDELAVRLEAEHRRRLTDGAKYSGRIAELEARIMSYAGLAVTKVDYESVRGATDTLRLAQRTLSVLKSESQAARAGSQAEALDDLAKRIHAQLRSTPASADTVEAAA